LNPNLKTYRFNHADTLNNDKRVDNEAILERSDHIFANRFVVNSSANSLMSIFRRVKTSIFSAVFVRWFSA